MKISRFNPSCDWYRHVILENDDEGAYIKVKDLVKWLRLHAKVGEISQIYTDLLKDLGE